MELFKANKQWASRPHDERFQSVAAMHGACLEYRASAATAKVPYSALRVEAIGDDIAVTGRSGVNATLTHWAMSQLSARTKAPAAYLRTLPATLAVQNLNHGLKERGKDDADDTANLLFHENGKLVLRAALTDSYTRIWNSDITERLLAMQAANPNWKNPMAYAVEAPGVNGSWPKMSGGMVPSGLYASDHDMFAFLVDESRRLEGSPEGLNRGFFIWNSEVGASSFGVMTFLYDRVCGNNIVWGATNVTEFRTRHVGTADARAFGELHGQVRRYMESSATEMEGKIEWARNFRLGTNKTEAIDALFKAASGAKIQELNRERLTQAVDLAEERTDRYGDPYSLWGAVGGLTEASQWTPHADERVKIDRAAGKLLKTIAF